MILFNAPKEIAALLRKSIERAEDEE